MILGILKHTPLWVWPLFAGLLYAGYVQSRTRSVPLARLVILPAVLISLSVYAVFSGFGPNPVALGGWFAAAALVVAINHAWRRPKGASYSTGTRTFTVPGSWWPLAVIVAIFFTRYAVTVLLVMNGELREVAAFAGATSFVYGLSSGFFLARTLGLARLLRP